MEPHWLAALVFGTVFRMTKVNGSWLFSTLYSFAGNNGNNDGAGPYAK